MTKLEIKEHLNTVLDWVIATEVESNIGILDDVNGYGLDSQKYFSWQRMTLLEIKKAINND